MRVMDALRRLHIITISGGYLGSDRDCEIVVSNQLLPERCAEIVYSEEAQCYSIEKLEDACILQVNGNNVKVVTIYGKYFSVKILNFRQHFFSEILESFFLNPF